MRIWLIQTGEMLPLKSSDRRMRTGHLAYELAKRGHQVLWWSSAFDHMAKKWIDSKDTTIKVGKNLAIKLVKSVGYYRNVSFRRFFDHWVLAWKFKKQSHQEPVPDLIVCSLPDHHLAYEVARYALKHNIPLVVDYRDLWPDLFVERVKSPILKCLLKIGLVRDFWKTRFVLKHADSLVSMMNYLLEMGRQKGKREINERDKVFYIGTQKSLIKNKNNIRKPIQSLVSSLQGKFIVLYIGTFNHICYPLHLVQAVQQLNQRGLHRKIEFILAGDGEHLKSLKRLAQEIPHISFTGWINNDEIAALLEIAHIGVATMNEPFNGFPNKIFTYLSGGLPILSALEGEVQELIQSENIGYSYPYNDVESLIERILLLEESVGLRQQMALNAKKAFDRLFDAQKIYSSYADHIEQVKALR